jgi:DNA-binding Lrp family transcriptional regulator
LIWEALLMGKRSDVTEDKLTSLLLEYLKDSSRSDRQIAKVLGVSEATVSRLKRRLVAEGLVYQFSVMPHFSKIGYEIMAFSCVKFKPEKITEIEARAKDWAQKNHEILFTSRTQGMGMDALTISVHKNYADYNTFIKRNRETFGDLIVEAHNMLIDLKGEVTKPFCLKYLAEEEKRKNDD